jgi:large subunit ribosomal protein L9
MRVVLTQDVPKLGESGTIQEVKDGYARNYLIPQGLASMATRGVVKQVEERQQAENRRIEKLEEEMRDLAGRIQATSLEIEARVGEQGRLFGSITTADIAERLSAAVGEDIDRRKIDLAEPIRTIGEYDLAVRLVGKLAPTVKVRVFDPDAPELAAEHQDEDAGEESSTDDAQVDSDEAEAVDAETEENEAEASAETDTDETG